MKKPDHTAEVNKKGFSKYFTKFFNQFSKYKKKKSSKPVSQSSSDTLEPTDNAQYYGGNKWISMSPNSYGTTTSYSWYNSSSTGYYYNYYTLGPKPTPTIGEDPVPTPQDSKSMTFQQYLDEYNVETHTLGKLTQQQSKKLKEDLKEEMAEFHKAIELEKQKENMPIYLIEFATAKVFLQYYANMSLQKPPPSLKPEQVVQVAKYLAATITCELRHRYSKCRTFWSKAMHMWLMLEEWEVSGSQGRQEAGKRFLVGSKDWDGFMMEQYLKLGAYIFGGSWEGGYGGWPWASVAWYASEWVSHAVIKGDIPIILWEKMLNAAHNTGRWMNKLGMGNVMGVLNMGANASPAFVAEIAKKALIVDNPNDFRRVIEKWADCSLPGEKSKLELPNPGVEVEVQRIRSSGKKSYIEHIKQQEKEAKEKSIILDAPDKVPVELSEGEDKKSLGIKPKVAWKSAKSEQIPKKQISVKSIQEVLKESLKKYKTPPNILKKGMQVPWKIEGVPLSPPKSYLDAIDLFMQSYAFQLDQLIKGGFLKIEVPEAPAESKIEAEELKPEAPVQLPPEVGQTEVKLKVNEEQLLKGVELTSVQLQELLEKNIEVSTFITAEQMEEMGKMVPPLKPYAFDYESASPKVGGKKFEFTPFHKFIHKEPFKIPSEVVENVIAEKLMSPSPSPLSYEGEGLSDEDYIKQFKEPKKQSTDQPNKYSTKGDGFLLKEEWAHQDTPRSESGGNETHEQVAAG